MVSQKASDIHISAGMPIYIRVDEDLRELREVSLNKDQTQELIVSMLSDAQARTFKQDWELDFAFGVEKLGRFRVNVFMYKGMLACSIRHLPEKIMTPEECGLPVNVVNKLCAQPKGLVLVTGATGSGKSTTLATMIEKINTERKCHIITVEDPIEYVHHNKSAIIHQRELGFDTHSFNEALRHVLRQDPDVILIGEMRDLETIEAALNIAETGHLVFATLHTSDSVQTINRIVDVFPEYQQQQVKIQLSFVLLGVISQQLIPHLSGKGRVLATEILIVTPAIRNLIRETKVHQMYSQIQTGQKLGMRTMNQSLYDLCMNKKISVDEALGSSSDPDELNRLFKEKTL
jgi:twitching motility protein PilT